MSERKKFVNCIKVQFNIIRKSVGARLVFGFFILLISYNYILNIKYYYGADVNNLPQSMFLNLLSMEKGNNISYFFLQLIPFLVVIPGSFSFIDEKNHGINNYYKFRTSRKQYIFSKAIAVFCLTFLVFEIPQLIEILLNTIAFPVKANGSPIGTSIYEISYIEQVKEYFCYEILVKHPYLYALLMTLKLSFFAGIMALFSLAVSTFGIKIKIFLFLPSYILLYSLAYLPLFISVPFNTNYFYYLFNYVAFQNLNFLAWHGFEIFLLLFSIIIFWVYTKKEDL